MIWTIIFWYSALINIIAIFSRGFDVANGTYRNNGVAYILQDFLDIGIAMFGLIGLSGMAYNESYFDQQLWQVYFFIAVGLTLVAYWTPKYSVMRQLYGNAQVVKSLFGNFAVVLPGYVAHYYYAFERVWL